MDSLDSTILKSYGRVASFSVHMRTSRCCTENVSMDGIKERTTAEQWKMVRQIMILVTRVVAGLVDLNEINLSVELNDSREFLFPI